LAEGSVRVFSVDGREWASANLTRGSATLAVSGLMKGRYFLVIEANTIGSSIVKPLLF
jgi:hypothetical protein